jgi:hypothetical protein
MLKFRSKNNMFIITVDGKDFIFPTLHDALEYIFYRKFMAQVAGKPIGSHNRTLFPVYSLLPPTEVRVAKFFNLGVEIL